MSLMVILSCRTKSGHTPGPMEDDCAPEDQPLDRGSTEAPQPTSLLTAGHFSLSLPVRTTCLPP